MGYFSNGTEAMMYEDTYCQFCKHHGDCAVWDAHFIYNYDFCNKKENPLNILIPRRADGFNEKCKMFMEKEI